MPTYFGVTTHRIIYKAGSFGTGKIVTAYIWNPSLTKSAEQSLTEVSDGLYYLDYAFAVEGTHFGKFYEGGVGTVSGVFRIATDIISVADIIAGVADGSYDLQEMMRIIFAVCAGKSSGGGTTTHTFRDSADSKNRVSAIVTSVGNRTAVTLDAT